MRAKEDKTRARRGQSGEWSLVNGKGVEKYLKVVGGALSSIHGTSHAVSNLRVVRRKPAWIQEGQQSWTAVLGKQRQKRAGLRGTEVTTG